MLKVEKTALKGVLKVTPPTIFEDFRGEYIEIYNQEIYQANGIEQTFIQDDISLSKRGVLRGIHGDTETTKLVSCIYGSFYLLVVNNDPSSSEYKKWDAFTLSDKNRLQILIPPSFGNGHIVMSEEAIFHYKQTTNYNRNGQFTITCNDPRFDFWLPMRPDIISIRDQRSDI